MTTAVQPVGSTVTGPTLRIADIRTALPGISDPTIRLTLETLKSQGLITVDGTGRSATWRMLRTEHWRMVGHGAVADLDVDRVDEHGQRSSAVKGVEVGPSTCLAAR